MNAENRHLDSTIFNKISEQIGNTDLLRIDSLSKISGCEILVKCEHQNPGGSI